MTLRSFEQMEDEMDRLRETNAGYEAWIAAWPTDATPEELTRLRELGQGDHMRRLLTADEVADRLSVDRATVYRWANFGWIPAYRIVQTIRFDPDELEEWISVQKVGAHPRAVRQVSAKGGRVARLEAAYQRAIAGREVAAQE